MSETRALSRPGAEIVYDVAGPLPTADGRPPLLMIGQPMTADGFDQLAAHFPERTVVTYDPRGLGRSARSDGSEDHDPEVQAGDLHALAAELGAGPVEVFASSGGAVTALAWVAAHPDDISKLVAHEPPLVALLPDAEAADHASAAVQEAYAARRWGHGMAAFIAMISWQGPFTGQFFAQPAPDPAMFGFPTEDDGSRDAPLFSNRSAKISGYRPDAEAVRA